MSLPTKALELPGRVEDSTAKYPTPEGCMGLVVELARLRVVRGSWRPFGAAVLEQGTGGLLAFGTNLVVPATCSIAHAETVAVMVVARAVGFDEGAKPPDRAAALEERGISVWRDVLREETFLRHHAGTGGEVCSACRDDQEEGGRR